MRNKSIILSLILGVSVLLIEEARGNTWSITGSYSSSCSQCGFYPTDKISCACQAPGGKSNITTLDLSTCPRDNDIANCNGTLTCLAAGDSCPSSNEVLKSNPTQEKP